MAVFTCGWRTKLGVGGELACMKSPLLVLLELSKNLSTCIVADFKFHQTPFVLI